MEDMMRNRKPDECYFYMEQNLAEEWELPDHKYWLEQSNDLMNDLRASTPEEALRSIYKVLDLMEKISHLTDTEYKFLIDLMPFVSSSEDSQ